MNRSALIQSALPGARAARAASDTRRADAWQAPASAPASAALSFENVTCTFVHGTSKQRYTAVDNATLSIAPGEFVSVVGPTGCGKSTLLNMAAGLLFPSSGKVLSFGREVTGINRHATYLFQGEALMPWRRAIDNICAGLQFANVDRAEARERAELWLTRVGLAGHGHKFPHQMSGGMRKRVALAQALILDPPLILMDEPFSALDIQTRQLMESELLALWQADRKSVLFITHDLDEAIALSDRVVVLSAGPGTRPIAEFPIDLPRPREVSEIRNSERFVALHTQIWDVLRDEVLKGYEQSKR
ncbi:ABC transporter ATP-binding protein [Paraburkholderia sp. ZP32-5]|uniref:ABC transporter ATP-binding protein n=1 Tax=Paraburkholderia sp. ZP32-5 TaxID=2883245 RepID=UPI001F417F61|nr:ABC transporter ATP-binding protein [Paraburkholderia sp. ZP32-5]